MRRLWRLTRMRCGRPGWSRYESESLDSLDGLLLTGGSDVNPVHYGQTRSRMRIARRPARCTGASLGAGGAEADLPVLGICRGLQLLNVALDGTLIQHLDPTTCTGSGQRMRRRASIRRRMGPGGAGDRLAEIVGAGGLEVNSRHHQAIESLGDGLVVSAISEDGVIEAVEKPGAAFVVAVQWHPEDRIFASDADRKLFEAFAAAMA